MATSNGRASCQQTEIIVRRSWERQLRRKSLLSNGRRKLTGHLRARKLQQKDSLQLDWAIKDNARPISRDKWEKISILSAEGQTYEWREKNARSRRRRRGEEKGQESRCWVRVRTIWIWPYAAAFYKKSRPFIRLGQDSLPKLALSFQGSIRLQTVTIPTNWGPLTGDAGDWKWEFSACQVHVLEMS